eukprot:TRINITY_DN42251_c0_g1_i1.p1 TRINITY_DN42251_c0_g1~~TRINITY_DN42251_c0_g1_i1.p1  ORF type:complete len:320 (+),score=70.35 TRINITY_DN42251_c0_g1_i1:35-994(+)
MSSLTARRSMQSARATGARRYATCLVMAAACAACYSLPNEAFRILRTSRRSGSGEEVRPFPPSSARMMVQQAADAVMAAFQDGVSRQSVRLRLDMVCPPNKVSEGGMEALLNSCLPMAKAFAQALQKPDGATMQQVRVSRFDGYGQSSGDVCTLLYRESADAKEDAAVVFLGGRKFVLQDSSQEFIDGMKDRLVVMMNSEDAATKFKIENKGMEGAIGGNWASDIAPLAKFCDDFKEESYYLRLLLISDWPLILFRAYPYNWEVYLEGLDGQPFRLLESKQKPSAERIFDEIRAYEKANDITAAQKFADKAARLDAQST